MLGFPWLHKPVVELLFRRKLASLMGQAEAVFGQGHHFYPLWRRPAAVISGGDRIDSDHLSVMQKPKVGLCRTLVTPVDGLHDISYREHTEAAGFGVLAEPDIWIAKRPQRLKRVPSLRV